MYTKKGEAKVSKYKIGDRPIVRRDIGKRVIIGDKYVDDEMKRLAGQKVTISNVYWHGYSIKENIFFWNDNMFESISIGDTVRLLNPKVTGIQTRKDGARVVQLSSGVCIDERHLERIETPENVIKPDVTTPEFRIGEAVKIENAIKGCLL